MIGAFAEVGAEVWIEVFVDAGFVGLGVFLLVCWEEGYEFVVGVSGHGVWPLVGAVILVVVAVSGWTWDLRRVRRFAQYHRRFSLGFVPCALGLVPSARGLVLC